MSAFDGKADNLPFLLVLLQLQQPLQLSDEMQLASSQQSLAPRARSVRELARLLHDEKSSTRRGWPKDIRRHPSDRAVLPRRVFVLRSPDAWPRDGP